MALRALMAKRKLDKLQAELAALEAVDFAKRESELETAIAEAETEEQEEAVAAEVEQFEADKKENEEKAEALRADIAAAEAELAEIEKDVPAPPQETEARETKEVKTMETRKFFGMSIQERDAFFAREDVRTWLSNIRNMKTRSLTGGAYTIPDVVLPLVYAEAEKSSKLIKYVRTPNVPGTSRQNIMGSVPEGVWTEMCGKINEVALGITQITLDGYKVGSFIPVCNALLEDSDIALATEIISMLGQGLGYAVDKAIVYGTGTKMPTGMAAGITVKTALGNKTEKALFKAFVTAVGSLSHKTGSLVWIMNEQTRLKVIGEAIGFNASAALVSSVDDTMPVIGGAIVEEDFVPDDEIIVGYGQRYVLARRAGIEVAASSEFKFTDDQTVFKATARYDGKPVFADSFIALSLTATAPTGAIDANHDFPSDTANA